MMLGLEPTVTGILGEGSAHRSGLDLALEVGDQLAVAFRFAMHGVLESLNQSFEVSDAFLERIERIWRWIARAAARSISGRSQSADLADPRDQPLPLAHRHRFPRRRRCAGRAGYRRRSLSVIMRVTSEPL
jgi:hypothetical protein